jgi:hypothetical protein
MRAGENMTARNDAESIRDRLNSTRCVSASGKKVPEQSQSAMTQKVFSLKELTAIHQCTLMQNKPNSEASIARDWLTGNVVMNT